MGIRPDSSSNTHTDLHTEGMFVPPTDPETLDKAIRAVTFVHLQQSETPDTIRASGEIFFALGLLEEPVRQGPGLGPIHYACPTCDIPAGARCVNQLTRQDVGGMHVARERLAKNAVA